jgi:hypothetical protein
MIPQLKAERIAKILTAQDAAESQDVEMMEV